VNAWATCNPRNPCCGGQGHCEYEKEEGGRMICKSSSIAKPKDCYPVGEKCNTRSKTYPDPICCPGDKCIIKDKTTEEGKRDWGRCQKKGKDLLLISALSFMNLVKFLFYYY
jgi:hypothetical protein